MASYIDSESQSQECSLDLSNPNGRTFYRKTDSTFQKYQCHERQGHAGELSQVGGNQGDLAIKCNVGSYTPKKRTLERNLEKLNNVYRIVNFIGSMFISYF